MSRRERLDQALRLCDEGRRLHVAGDSARAEPLFRQVLELDPNNPEALHRLGLIVSDRGEFAAAAELMRQSIALAPQVPEFYNNLGETYRKMGRWAESVECYERAIKMRPVFAEANNNLALALTELGANEAAIAAAERAVAQAPGHFMVYCTLGDALRAANRHADAIATYRQCLALKPGVAQAVHGEIVSGAALGRPLDELLEAAGATAEIAVLHAATMGYLAAGRYAAAEEAAKRGLALEEDDFHLTVALGMIRSAENDFTAAIALHRRAIALCDIPGPHINLATCLLTEGNFAEGWREYENRARPSSPTDQGTPRPVWRGEDPARKTILLAHEQGLGDTIQFIRYAALLAARGAKVVVQAPAALAALLRTAPGVSEVFADRPAQGFDAYCHIVSLPHVFGTTLETIPAKVPYLQVDGRRGEQWRQRVAEHGSGFRVGLCWQGNPAHMKDFARSMKLRQLVALGDVPGVQLFSLQKGAGREQLADASARRVVDLGQEFADLSDTAGAIMALDLVISVDTSIIHLAGALGRPVWSLHALNPDFRWLLGRADSPWYPTMRLYRQGLAGDWSAVVEAVARDLAAVAAGRGAG